MGAPYTYAKRKLEDALALLLTRLGGTTLSGVTVYKGFSFADLEASRIEIVCATAEAERLGAMPGGGYMTGNFIVNGMIAVVSHKDDVVRGTHAARCGAVEDIIMRDDVEEQMNTLGVGDFYIHSPDWRPTTSEDLISGSEARTELNFTARVRPSTPEEV